MTVDTEARFRQDIAAEVNLRTQAEADRDEARANQGILAAEMGNAILANARSEADLTVIRAERDALNAKALEREAMFATIQAENEVLNQRAVSAVTAQAPEPAVLHEKVGEVVRMLAAVREQQTRDSTKPVTPIAFDLDVRRGEMGEIRKMRITEVIQKG